MQLIFSVVPDRHQIFGNTMLGKRNTETNGDCGLNVNNITSHTIINCQVYQVKKYNFQLPILNLSLAVLSLLHSSFVLAEAEMSHDFKEFLSKASNNEVTRFTIRQQSTTATKQRGLLGEAGGGLIYS